MAGILTDLAASAGATLPGEGRCGDRVLRSDQGCAANRRRSQVVGVARFVGKRTGRKECGPLWVRRLAWSRASWPAGLRGATWRARRPRDGVLLLG